MTIELHSLTRFTLPSEAGAHDFELRIPQMRLLTALITWAEVQNAQQLALNLPLMVMSFVERVDGDPPTLARADALAQDAELMRQLLVRIRTMLDTLRERGAVFALCPRCGLWEAEVGMTPYALTIAAPLPSTFDGPFLAEPSLASNLVPENRPPIARAARIRFELPSVSLGIQGPIAGGVLGDVDYAPEEFEDPAWDADSAEEASYEEEDDAPIRTGAGWIAQARLARALDPPLSDDEVERLPAIDFFFLDLVHYLVALAPIAPNTAGRIRCPRCATEFLPVRRDPTR